MNSSSHSFQIRARHKQAIIDHAMAANPIEACGVIARSLDGNPDRLIPMNNVAEEWGTSFEFEPEQQMAVWNDIETRNEAVAAVYHSHTKHSAVPSSRDVTGAAAAPERTMHIIVSVQNEDPEFRVWSIVNGIAKEQEIEVIG